MNAFSRSWMITKLSFAVINKDRELLAFAPVVIYFFDSLCHCHDFSFRIANTGG